MAGKQATLYRMVTDEHICPFGLKSKEWFIAFSMCVLAILKLRDLDSFSNQFITYDLLAMRVVRYSYVYPFAEAAGIHLADRKSHDGGHGHLDVAGALILGRS